MAWFSSRSVREYAAFHEYIARRDSPPLIVDVAELVRDGVASSERLQCFAFVSTELFVAADLLSRTTRMSSVAFAEARRRWARLKRDGASLRVLERSGLVSAPITYFDDELVAGVTREWQKCARVIGDALYRCNSGEFDQVRDSFLWFRLRELIEEDGVLDGRGDTSSMFDSFVRRPT